uniref:SET domain-containing protein n=1 Tax=Acrobeloides nanus TaxID=290746 RepID=A0A914DT80_9BILA
MAKLINIAEIYNKKPGEFSTIMDEWEFGVDGGFPVNGPNPGGNVTRFINHSCEPNIISRLVFIDTHDTRLPHLAFFAFRDIEAGEEIFWDYAYDASPNSSFNCQCGTEKCRWKKNKEA